MSIEGGPELLEFVYTEVFERSRRKLLDDETLRVMELGLAERPRRGPVEPGTGGVRKVRVGLEGKGKSGGARVMYLYDEARSRIYLLLAYSKSDQAVMTSEQRARIRRLADRLKE